MRAGWVGWLWGPAWPRAPPGMPTESSLFQPLVLGGIAGSTAEIIVMPMIVV